MNNNIAKQVTELINAQMKCESFARNYHLLENVISREMKIGNMRYVLQFNPERIRSAAAPTDKKSIEKRRCFLCRENRPAEQLYFMFKNRYEVLLNPYPIFSEHLTIVDSQHTPQNIEGRIGDMLDLAAGLTDFVIFYNGPECGASAPDHFHFQAGNKSQLPLQKDFKTFADKKKTITFSRESYLSELIDAPVNCLLIESADKSDTINIFNRITSKLKDIQGNDKEPMINLLCWWEDDRWVLAVFPRKSHRPRQFFSEGEDKLLVSPATVEMSGIFVLAREEDFNKMTPSMLMDVLQQVSISNQQLTHLI